MMGKNTLNPEPIKIKVEVEIENLRMDSKEAKKQIREEVERNIKITVDSWLEVLNKEKKEIIDGGT